MFENGKKVVEFCLDKKVDGSGIFLAPQQNLTLKNDWFPHAASGAFFVLFFWSFCFSNSKQYERVFVQETKTCFDYSPNAVTIKYKMTFFGNKINKVWRIFECTTYLFCTIKRKSVYWRYTKYLRAFIPSALSLFSSMKISRSSLTHGISYTVSVIYK